MTDCPGVDCIPQESSEAPLTENGIRLLVDRFYDKVRQDALLGPVFARAIPDDAWPAHLATMRDFWSSVMLTSGRYHGNPVAAHRRLDGIKPAHFERWLALFGETCRELFGDKTAAAFVDKANRIATSLQLAMFYRPENDLLAPQRKLAGRA
ncbi:group III truncated hemoglobin [Methyloceanibacter caenitepidi]|uniref:Truncated hemoglobins n=1 Tax=Methyloceanibacter caenitepidi TaxID=1384459 RepID=A0A0A8K657_9HYPH|nr:group III truncated hemoglobin [Methyloceanibacter caenitepidi]BAQ18413.1 truncated hemoglobins [Methyloceanibacter caenitepidi]